jgi:uncharacterized DUF497 family protein
MGTTGGIRMVDNTHTNNYNIIIGDVHFEWSSAKNRLNVQKHQVSFEEALTVFFDDHYIEIADPDHSENEERFIALGYSEINRLLIVCHCVVQNDEAIRIISSRKATSTESKVYGEKTNAKRV